MTDKNQSENNAIRKLLPKKEEARMDAYVSFYIEMKGLKDISDKFKQRINVIYFGI